MERREAGLPGRVIRRSGQDDTDPPDALALLRVSR
jgi:hypothetical protein